MKKEFAQLIKDMRVALRPEFKTITANGPITGVPHLKLDEALEELEKKQHQMVIDGGYTQEEFDIMSREYYMDFTSDNPDEWVIKHDPENPVIISHN